MEALSKAPRPLKKAGKKREKIGIKNNKKDERQVLTRKILRLQVLILLGEKKKLAKTATKVETKRTSTKLSAEIVIKKAITLLTAKILQSDKTSCSLGYLHLKDC